MKGAIIGDIVGSIYEFHNIKTKDFPFFSPNCFFTDDTVLTVAVAAAMERVQPDAPDAAISRRMLRMVRAYGFNYPDRGYGRMFLHWLESRHARPYYSSGNGSAMRVSPVAWYARSLEDCERLARLSAEITHDHPDGICGAQATAGAVYLALHGGSKGDIMHYVSRYYDWDFCLDEIRPTYKFDHFASVNEGTVPYAVQAFLESEDFEDAIRNVISIGGDSDTLAAVTGAIAEAFYGVPEDLWTQARTFIADEGDKLLDVVDRFYETVGKR